MMSRVPDGGCGGQSGLVKAAAAAAVTVVWVVGLYLAA